MDGSVTGATPATRQQVSDEVAFEPPRTPLTREGNLEEPDPTRPRPRKQRRVVGRNGGGGRGLEGTRAKRKAKRVVDSRFQLQQGLVAPVAVDLFDDFYCEARQSYCRWM